VSVSELIREGVEFYRQYEDRISEDKKIKHWRRSGVMLQVFPEWKQLGVIKDTNT